jgi:hypothetical protein
VCVWGGGGASHRHHTRPIPLKEEKHAAAGEGVQNDLKAVSIAAERSLLPGPKTSFTINCVARASSSALEEVGEGLPTQRGLVSVAAHMTQALAQKRSAVVIDWKSDWMLAVAVH